MLYIQWKELNLAIGRWLLFITNTLYQQRPLQHDHRLHISFVLSFLLVILPQISFLLRGLLYSLLWHQPASLRILIKVILINFVSRLPICKEKQSTLAKIFLKHYSEFRMTEFYESTQFNETAVFNDLVCYTFPTRTKSLFPKDLK